MLLGEVRYYYKLHLPPLPLSLSHDYYKVINNISSSSSACYITQDRNTKTLQHNNGDNNRDSKNYQIQIKYTGHVSLFYLIKAVGLGLNLIRIGDR